MLFLRTYDAIVRVGEMIEDFKNDQPRATENDTMVSINNQRFYALLQTESNTI